MCVCLYVCSYHRHSRSQGIRKTKRVCVLILLFISSPCSTEGLRATDQKCYNVPGGRWNGQQRNFVIFLHLMFSNTPLNSHLKPFRYIFPIEMFVGYQLFFMVVPILLFFGKILTKTFSSPKICFKLFRTSGSLSIIR